MQDIKPETSQKPLYGSGAGNPISGQTGVLNRDDAKMPEKYSEPDMPPVVKAIPADPVNEKTKEDKEKDISVKRLKENLQNSIIAGIFRRLLRI